MLQTANDFDFGIVNASGRGNAEKRSRGVEAQVVTESLRIGPTQPPSQLPSCC
jgi:hypothetical protein